MLYGRRLPLHTTDHTRRSKDDILVYSESELRAAVGNIERGKRVVVVGTVPITKPVRIKIAKTKNTNITSQFVIITGFGSGRLVRKVGVEDPFDLFLIGTDDEDDPVGIQFLDLSFSGFKTTIAFRTADIYNLTVNGCTTDDCSALLGKGDNITALTVSTVGAVIESNFCYSDGVTPVTLSTDVSYTESIITNNRVTTPPSVPAPAGATTFSGEFSKGLFSGNWFGLNQSVFILETLRSVITGNSFESVTIDGASGGDFTVVNGNWCKNFMTLSNLMGAQITGNSIGEVINDASNQATIFDGNFLGITGLVGNLLPNAESLIVRNNTNLNTGLEVGGAGRIPIDGELLGQTILDGSSLFSYTPGSLGYTQLKDGTDKAFVTFYVPSNRKVTIKMTLAFQSTSPGATFDDGQFDIRITDTDDDTTPASFAASTNVERSFIAMLGQLQVYPVEWYIDGTAFASPWDIGEEVTLWFQVLNTDSYSADVDIVAGDWAGPMSIASNAAHRDINVVVT